MKIHEYQAKLLFREFGVPVPEGEMAETAQKAVEIAERIGYPCVVKAQVHAGGRGKAGGIRLAKSREEIEQAARGIIGMKLVSPQTGPQGKQVRKVLIEKAQDIVRELYLAVIIDREKEMPVLIASSQGGMEIEEVSAAHPELIFKQHIHPVIGLWDCHSRSLGFKLDFHKEQHKAFSGIISRLYDLFSKKDCSLVEINPLIVTRDGSLLALDGKINFDDNALFRQPDILEMRDILEEEPLEVEASRYSLNYIKLDGNIGCMVNGAGLAMATMDIIKYYGGNPANFLDVGGATSVERVKEAFKILLSDPHVRVVFVNIFGGIVRTDLVATGIVNAVQGMDLKIPVVVRLIGTNEAEGRKILLESALNFISESDLAEAVRRAVALAAQGA